MHKLPGRIPCFSLVPAITRTALTVSEAHVLLTDLTHVIASFHYQAFVGIQLINRS